jgi:hypothetical protein
MFILFVYGPLRSAAADCHRPVLTLVFTFLFGNMQGKGWNGEENPTE